MTILENLEVISVGLGIVGATAGVLVAIYKKGRKLYLKRAEERESLLSLPSSVCDLSTTINEIRHNQGVFAEELRVNGGGSIKDEVRLLAAEKKLELSSRPYPLIRCKANGDNVLVNRAFANLLETTEKDLLESGWLKFIANKEQYDDFYSKWQIAAANYSSFAGLLDYRSFGIEGGIKDRGRWLVRIDPLGDYHDDFLFCGVLMPHDKVAHEIADAFHWKGGKTYKKIPLWETPREDENPDLFE